MARNDVFAIALSLACLFYGCTARADEAPAPDTRHAACLVITPHASPTVGADSQAPASAPQIAAHAVDTKCPEGFGWEAGTCLPL